MKTENITIPIKTKGEFDIIDMTEKIKDFINQTGIKNGLVNIQSLHTTTAFIFNENEPLLLKDFKSHLEKLSPKNIKYNHDNLEERTINLCDDECINGHSHCKAILLPANICLNLIEGKLQLGTWQKIMFIELDRARQRKIQIQVIGE